EFSRNDCISSSFPRTRPRATAHAGPSPHEIQGQGRQDRSVSPSTPAFAGVTITRCEDGRHFKPHSEEKEMKLYTYYRSQASFRVRIALNLKGINREDSFLHLEKGDQFAAEYRAINPQMVVPPLIDGEFKLFQSLAILEYLDETYPHPPLL